MLQEIAALVIYLSGMCVPKDEYALGINENLIKTIYLQ